MSSRTSRSRHARFSGADLANQNEALFAARRTSACGYGGLSRPRQDHHGRARRTMVCRRRNRNTAYHESGPSSLLLLTKTGPGAQGDHHSAAARWASPCNCRRRIATARTRTPVADISVLFGGRIAEEIFMHQMTTGASTISSAPPTSPGAWYGHVRCARPDGTARTRAKFLGRSVTTTRMSRKRHAAGRRRDPSHHRPAVRWRAS